MSEFPFKVGDKITQDEWVAACYAEVAAIKGDAWVGFDEDGLPVDSDDFDNSGWRLWVPVPETRQWIITTEHRETTALSMFVDVIDGRPDLRHFIDPRTLVVDSVGAAGKLADVVMAIAPHVPDLQPEPDGATHTIWLECGCSERRDEKQVSYVVGDRRHCGLHCVLGVGECQRVVRVVAEPFLNATQETK